MPACTLVKAIHSFDSLIKNEHRQFRKIQNTEVGTLKYDKNTT